MRPQRGAVHLTDPEPRVVLHGIRSCGGAVLLRLCCCWRSLLLHCPVEATSTPYKQKGHPHLRLSHGA